MCGIVGYVGPPDDAIVAAMRDSLAHRGPDAAGSFSDDRVSLGHRRLAIVDVTGGQQPAFNEDRTIVVAYNGEIYNHPQLRPELEAKGHRFASNADTESLIHLYEEEGFACVQRLEGMFAFVLYDKRKNLLFGARDRMGEKPLYYTSRLFGDVPFAFASEPKALARHPALKPAFGLSESALVSYLLHDYTTGVQSIAEGVSHLPAGAAFTYGLPGSGCEGFRSWQYWKLDFRPSNEDGGRFLDLLGGAVRRQLMSDVPLGVFLSGGVDSSTLAMLLAKVRPAAEIDSFSIGFDDPSFDESPYAASAAAMLGTRHHVRRFTANDLLARLPKIAEHLDEPFADPSILPVSMLCEYAREHVTVALGGDGGDELLAGYDPFRAVAAGRWYRRLVPDWFHRRLAMPAARLLPVSDRNMDLAFKAARFLRGAIEPEAVRPAAWMGPFTLAGLRKLIPDLAGRLKVEDAYAVELEGADALERASLGGDALIGALEFFQRVYLADDILVKVDRASMMHSLEVRCPYLDAELVAYSNRLASSLKLHRGDTKHLLKRTLAGPPELLPASIVRRKKKGFGIPAAAWLRRELRPEFERRVLNEWPADLAMFDRREIARLWERHLSRTENHYKELWALLMLAWWRQAR